MSISYFCRTFLFIAASWLLTSTGEAQDTAPWEEPWAFLPCKSGEQTCLPMDRAFPHHDGFEVYAVTDKKAIMYLQIGPYKKNANIVNVWDIADYSFAKSDDEKIVTFRSINCLTKKIIILQQEQYHKYRQMDTLQKEDSWRYISPESMENMIRKKVCL